MENETFYRVAVVSLYALFHALRGFYALSVTRSGGKAYSKRDDDAQEGRFHSSFGLLIELVMPVSIALYAVYPAWVARLSLPFPISLRLSGAGLSIASLVFLCIVHRALGRHWSASLRLRDDHQLVITGPYARIRHPMYTGLIGNMIGLSLVASNLVVLLPRAIQISLLLLRTRKEERMMLAHFGDDYHAYMRRTGRLMPRRRNAV